jgi:general stress protein 26
MSDAANISKVTGIINDSHTGMFTSVNEEGARVSRPLTVQDVKDDGDMWFFTSANTSQAAHIKANPAVNVSFGQRTEWVSVSGTAEVVTAANSSATCGTRWWRPGSPADPTPRKLFCSTWTRTPPSTGRAPAGRLQRCCNGSSPRSRTTG